MNETKEPLLTQRKAGPPDVEAAVRPAEEKPPAKPRAKTQQAHPQQVGVPLDMAELDRFADDHRGLMIACTVLPPLFCLWLYIQGMNALYPYHPATHWPEPFLSIAATCIEAAGGKKLPSCENIFYIQVSTLLFASCGALNGLIWAFLWSMVKCVNRTPFKLNDPVVPVAAGGAVAVAMIGAFFSCILTLNYILGYGGLKCGEGKLPECVYGYHPAFYAVWQWVIAEAAFVSVVIAAGCGCCSGKI